MRENSTICSRPNTHDICSRDAPVCAVVATCALDIIENDNLVDLCAQRGREFFEILGPELKELHVVHRIHQLDVMIEVDLISDTETRIEQKPALSVAVGQDS
jgi:4-aminobutyrate aminotransferase-like enzyme